MIYFIEILGCDGIDPGTIKIGYTARMVSRYTQHKTAFGDSIRLLGVIGGDREWEAVMHRRFDKDRIDAKELFRPSTELMTFIREHARRWTLELDDDPDFDRTLKVLFDASDVAKIERIADEAGYGSDSQAFSRVLDRAIAMLEEFLGLPPMSASIPPEDRSLPAKNRHLEGSYEPSAAGIA